MRVVDALLAELRKVLVGNYDYQAKVDNYLKNNNYRILEELGKKEILDVLAMLDPDLYVKVKSQIETMEIRQDIAHAIGYIDSYLDSHKEEFVTFARYEFDACNVLYLVSKKIFLSVSISNNNNPFHNYETKHDKDYWANFIIKCQFNDDLVMYENDDLLKTLINNHCPIFKVRNLHRAEQVLEGFK